MNTSDSILEKIVHFSKPFVKKSRFEDEEEILSLLKANEEPVQLLNYYRNLPICYDAEILNVENRIVEFRVHPYQAISISEDRFSFLKHSVFPDGVVAVARSQFIHVKKRVIFLKDFQYAEFFAEKRRAVRLAIDLPSEAVIRCGKVQVGGKILDISIDATAIQVSGDVDFIDGAEVDLDLHLPALQEPLDLHVKAHVYRKIPAGDKMLYIFTLCHNRSIASDISRYIFRRQTEIIRELKDVCPDVPA